MRIILVLFAASTILLSCSTKKEEKQEQTADTTPKQDTLPFFDVSEMVLKDLMNIEGLKNTFYQLSENSGKKDSAVVDKNQVMKLAAPFFELKLNNPAIKKAYHETPFYDSLSRSFVINYETDDVTMPTKLITLMLTDPQQEFKRVDFMRSFQRNDSSFEERLSYTAGKQFQIIQLISSGGTELTKKTYVYWRERK